MKLVRGHLPDLGASKSGSVDEETLDSTTGQPISDEIAAQVIRDELARSRRILQLPNQDDMLVMAKIMKMTASGVPVSRGAVIEAFASEGDNDKLPESTTFRSMSDVAGMGLIDASIDATANRLSGRPVQKISLTPIGREVLRKYAEFLNALSQAAASRASPKSLN
ncbi:MAG TPA: hypothetical protein PKW21_14555 [Rhabdaerophilum sp.]|nr:hypothetical protein [Rhabdaerophilum sp.]